MGPLGIYATTSAAATAGFFLADTAHIAVTGNTEPGWRPLQVFILGGGTGAATTAVGGAIALVSALRGKSPKAGLITAGVGTGLAAASYVDARTYWPYKLADVFV